MTLDLHDLEHLRPAIDKRLADFQSVPESAWLRELMLCLLTPQSMPQRAEACILALESKGLFHSPLSLDVIAAELREPTRYIRFHNVKARRIARFLDQACEISAILTAGVPPQEERAQLVKIVDGFGLKEASHALRNVGRRGLAILDRHILRNLVELDVLSAYPSSISPKKYLEIEDRFINFADSISVPIDVLDLYFWQKEAGEIYK